MNEKKCRWGIISTGNIAHRFANDLALMDEVEIAAVGSRSQESADRFGREYGIARCHGSYEALAADPDVNVVYVATPHPMHRDNTIMCLERGKPVLCEKPMALCEADAAEMVRVARDRGVFLMQGMWTYFFPVVTKARELIESGRIGEVRMVECDFGFRGGWDPAGRLLSRELGGGALLDVGIYPVALAHLFLGGEPEKVVAAAHIGETGVDEQTVMSLRFGDGRLAALSCAIRTQTKIRASIYGTEGHITIATPCFRPTYMVVQLPDAEREEIHLPPDGRGFTHEIREVIRCLRAGETESPVLTHEISLGIMRTLDRIRAVW